MHESLSTSTSYAKDFLITYFLNTQYIGIYNIQRYITHWSRLKNQNVTLPSRIHIQQSLSQRLFSTNQKYSIVILSDSNDNDPQMIL